MVETAIPARYAITKTRFNIVPLLTVDAITTGVRLFMGTASELRRSTLCGFKAFRKLAGVDLANCDLLHDCANSVILSGNGPSSIPSVVRWTQATTDNAPELC
jgi:hypothetical protein